jgi:hypothetical protein
MEVKVIFTYLNRTIQIFCKEDEQMEAMFKEFTKKLDDDSEPNHYIYYCENNILRPESTIKNNKYLSNQKEINISVQKKLRFIKCPNCKCNDSIINLDNYLVLFYGCKTEHSSRCVYDKYIGSQKIDSGEIICSESNCGRTINNYINGLYICLNCSKLTKNPKYYCKDHINKHNKEHKNVKFDKQNYYCEKHFNEFIKYCFTHHKNICKDCEKEHENDKIAKYSTMEPDLKKLKESLKTMENNINDVTTIIDDLKNRLDGTLRIFKRYLYIAKDMIAKYELFNNDLKNNRILRSLWNLQLSNTKMNDELKKIIDEDNLVEKVKQAITIYENRENNYNKNLNETFDNKNEDDEWWEEIKKENKNEKENGNGNNKIGASQLKKNKTKTQKK